MLSVSDLVVEFRRLRVQRKSSHLHSLSATSLNPPHPNPSSLPNSHRHDHPNSRPSPSPPPTQLHQHSPNHHLRQILNRSSYSPVREPVQQARVVVGGAPGAGEEGRLAEASIEEPSVVGLEFREEVERRCGEGALGSYVPGEGRYGRELRGKESEEMLMNPRNGSREKRKLGEEEEVRRSEDQVFYVVQGVKEEGDEDGVGEGLRRGRRRSTGGGGGREGSEGRVEATLEEVEKGWQAREEEREKKEREGYPRGEEVEGEGHRCEEGGQLERRRGGKEVVSSTAKREGTSSHYDKSRRCDLHLQLQTR